MFFTSRGLWMRDLSIFSGVLAAFLFGLATPASKFLLAECNAFLLAGLLYLGAAIGVLPAVGRRQPRGAAEKTVTAISRHHLARQRLKIVGAVVCGGLLGPLFLLFGLKTAHAASVAVWLNMELVATAVLGVLFFHDHLDASGWIGVLLALCAGIIMTLAEGAGGGVPALLVSLACVCWGFDNHLTALIDSLSPARLTFLKGIAAGSVNFLIGLGLSGRLPPVHLLGAALLLGAASYGLSIVLYVLSAQNLGATRSQILFSGAPFFGILLSILFLQEPFRPAHVGAMGCMALGIYFSSRLAHTHWHDHAKMTHTHLHDHRDGHHGHAHVAAVGRQKHSHPHTHAPMSHAHPHYPDLHHRHEDGHGSRTLAAGSKKRQRP